MTLGILLYIVVWPKDHATLHNTSPLLHSKSHLRIVARQSVTNVHTFELEAQGWHENNYYETLTLDGCVDPSPMRPLYTVLPHTTQSVCSSCSTHSTLTCVQILTLSLGYQLWRAWYPRLRWLAVWASYSMHRWNPPALKLVSCPRPLFKYRREKGSGNTAYNELWQTLERGASNQIARMLRHVLFACTWTRFYIYCEVEWMPNWWTWYDR